MHFIVEGPEVFDTAATAGEHDQIETLASRSMRQHTANFDRSLLALDTRGKDDDLTGIAPPRENPQEIA